eukprot:6181193-Pleurochrysis_carterae.AAC.1
MARHKTINNKDDAEGVTAMTKPADIDMASAPVKSPSCEARHLEVKDSMRPCLPARKRGSPKPMEPKVVWIGHWRYKGQGQHRGGSSSRDLSKLEFKDSAHSGLLASAHGPYDSKVMDASRSSNDGGGNKDDMEGVLAVTKLDDMGMAGAPDDLSFCDARQLELKEPTHSLSKPPPDGPHTLARGLTVASL